MVSSSLRAISIGAVAALAVGLTAAPAEAYTSPEEVPNPFQDYGAQDYADALWNLHTTLKVRTHERTEHEDCDVQEYTVTGPLNGEVVSEYVQVISSDDTWCASDEGDELRDSFDERAAEEDNFYHGLPYENRRDEYYGVWADTNGNGVTSRTEIHARDLENSDFVVSGTYFDHYNGDNVNIAETETAGEHMVPVGFTWPEMQHRSQQDRVDYYNDPMNLTSTTGPTNRFKDGKTPSEWLPDHGPAQCPYALAWTHTTSKHDISLYNSDITFLKDFLSGCLKEQLDDGQVLDPESRSSDLDWAELPPENLTAAEDAPTRNAEGPSAHASGLDYADALWNLERHVPVRSVEREEHDECDVETATISDSQGETTATYARVMSPENGYCSGEEGDELREELDAEAEEDSSFFHGSPLAGQSRAYFGYWQMQDGLTTGQHVLGRDLRETEWNSNETGVLGGWTYDPYTADRLEYDPRTTAVDAVLPIQHAWIDMEQRSQDERSAFANDPMNLLVTSADVAQDKGSSGPRGWMPKHEGFQCRYALTWTATASKYQISLYESDFSQLRQTLYWCMSDPEEQSDEAQGTRRAELDWASLPPL